MSTLAAIEPKRLLRIPGLLALPAYLMGGGGILALAVFAASMVQLQPLIGVATVFACGLAGMFWLYGLRGFTILEPNQAVVGLFFGSYAGTYQSAGFHYLNPFLSQFRASLRVQTFETPHLKVNELGGRPIMIGAVVTWAVTEPEAALLSVQDFQSFLKNRTEIALREVAAAHPYESDDEHRDCLRGNTANISAELKKRLGPYATQAGLDIQDITITQLAYAPEIAGIMLVKQQAESLLAARRVIVEGAVRIASDAIKQLEAEGLPIPEAERGRALVNLLTVLASDRGTQPTVSVDG